jgi:hypothetical protein
MKLHEITAVTALAGLAIGLAMTASAEAAPKKQPKYIYYGSQDRMVYARGRAPTRVTVYRRSYLTGGTETLQRDQHYTDYSHPPNYYAAGDKNDPKVSFFRSPLPDPWDIPGWPKY